MLMSIMSPLLSLSTLEASFVVIALIVSWWWWRRSKVDSSLLYSLPVHRHHHVVLILMPSDSCKTLRLRLRKRDLISCLSGKQSFTGISNQFLLLVVWSHWLKEPPPPASLVVLHLKTRQITCDIHDVTTTYMMFWRERKSLEKHWQQRICRWIDTAISVNDSLATHF